MDTCRLGIFHQRYPDTIPQAKWPTPARIQSAARWFFIFYRRTAHVFFVAWRAHLSSESAVGSGSESASAIQRNQVGAIDLNRPLKVAEAAVSAACVISAAASTATTSSRFLLIADHALRRRLGHFNLRTHLLDLCVLLFQMFVNCLERRF